MKRELLAFALLSAACVSCTDDSYDLDNISNDYSIDLNEYLPIASSQVKLKDILSEFKTKYITEDSDRTIVFKFDTTNRVYLKPIDIIFEKTTYDFPAVEIPDLKVVDGVIPAGIPFTVNLPLDMTIKDQNGEGKIDQIFVKEGKLRFQLDIETDGSGKIDVSPIRIYETNIPHKSLLPGDILGVDLTGSVLDFTVMDSIKVTLAAGSEIPVHGSNLRVKMTMLDDTLSYKKIYGSFASNYEQIERTDFYINLYDDNIDFHLNVLDPSLKIVGRTNSGIPLSCSIKNLVGKHKSLNSSKKDSVKAVFYRNQPSLRSDTFYFDFKNATVQGEETVAFNETFDGPNGNLDSIFSYLPDSVSLACGIKINATPESGVSYYLLDSTYIELDIEASVPLAIGDSSYLTIRDTVDKINIVEEITDYQEGSFKLDQAEIYVEFENELPLEAVVTAQFCRADTVNGKVQLTRINNKKLDQTVHIPAAETKNGFKVKATPSLTKISVSDDMVDDIKRINAVDFTYRIKVPKGSVDGVYLTSDCGMSAKVYGHVKANISNSEK